MTIGSFIAIYFVIWWLAFVAVLPIGTRSHHETGTPVLEGNDPGAPVNPRLLQKVLITTVLAALVTGLMFWGLTNDWISHYLSR